MPLIIIFAGIIALIHYLGAETSLPLALTSRNLNINPLTYLWGNFVHESYEHLIYDLTAFILIYYLSPRPNLMGFNKYALKYLAVFVAVNTVLNIFIMSKWFPGGHLSFYRGISAANFTMYFLIALCWLNQKLSFSITLIVLGVLFAGTSPLIHELTVTLGISMDVGKISIWSHVCGSILSLPLWFAIRRIF